jgi:hypothetical protein
MTITEKVAYLKGLAEGMKLDTDKNEGKLLAAIIDTLAEICDEIDALDDAQIELAEQLDAVDEDLSAVEDIIYEDDDCDCDCDDCEDENEYIEALATIEDEAADIEDMNDICNDTASIEVHEDKSNLIITTITVYER